MAAFNKDFLSENDFEAGLAIFCCYGHDDNSSKAVDKIARSGKVYHKMTFVYYSLLHSRSVSLITITVKNRTT